MENHHKQPDDSLRTGLKPQDFEYLTIVTLTGLVSEVVPFASHEEAKKFLLLAAHEMDNSNASTLSEINKNSLNHYSIWQLDDMGGRYNDVT